jgi:cytochrome c-type biogenesis protein CcmH
VTLNRYAEARDAFEAAARLTPENPEVLTRLAEAAALAAGGDLRGEPEAVLQRALALRPDYPSALWLAGLAASQGGRYAEAVGHWESLLALAQDPEDRAMISQHLEQVKREAGVTPLAGGAPGDATRAPTVTPAPPPESPALSVAVSLAPGLQDRVSAADTVFVFARPAEGPRMPLAIVRTTAGELPTTVVLDDSAVMNPGTKLSTVPRIVVGARVSKSGTAMPQPGDLEGLSAPLSPADVSSIAVTIDTPR